MRSCTVRCLLTLAAPTLLFAIPALSQGTPRSLESSRTSELMDWLPADTETVVVARGPFSVSASPEFGTNDEQGYATQNASDAHIRETLVTLALELPYGLEEDVNDFDLAKALHGHTVTIAMEGSRHFREPRGESEVVDFEGCSIVVFEKALGGSEGKFERLLRRKDTRTETIDGTQVLIFGNKLYGTDWTDLIAIPRPNVLLVANSRDYLKEVLGRILQPRLPRALPDKLPEWRFLDPNAHFWGLRHFDSTQAKLDPTSPLRSDPTFASPDSKAIGVLFEVDPNNDRNASIIKFSGDEANIRDAAKAGKIIARPEGDVTFEVKLSNPEPGVLQQSYALNKSSTLDYFILAVEFALGRGMYI